LRNSNANKYAAFGQPMQDLVALIQANAKKFKKLPRGPIGSCFTVKVKGFVIFSKL